MKRTSLILVIVSVALVLILRSVGPENEILFLALLAAWFISLLVIAYVSTPSNSILGKIIFGCTVTAIAGVAFKLLHLNYADALIIVGLVGVVGGYGIIWFRSNADS
jgi:hypothetical protein